MNSTCICENNTSKHVKFGQQMLGLTLTVHPW